MTIADVNVMLYAMLPRFEQHQVARNWLSQATAFDSIGTWEPMLAAVVRISSNKNLFDPPAEMSLVMNFIDAVRSSPNHIAIVPTPAMWTVFSRLLRETGTPGPSTTDALFAALAIDQNATFATFDRGFGRFRGLKWVMPA